MYSLEVMSHFTLPQVKQFQQRMVANLIRDVKKEVEEEKQRWELTFQTVENFNASMTIQNSDLLDLCKRSRAPAMIAERIKFGLLAEDFFRKKLQLVMVDDMPVDEQADIHHEMWKQFQTMRKIDGVKTSELQRKFQAVTSFQKLADNDYVVNTKKFFT